MLLRLFNRRTLFLLLMGGAVGIPYALESENWPEKLKSLKEKVFSKDSSRAALSLANTYAGDEVDGTAGAGAPTAPMRPSATLVGPQIHNLEQVFRFDITPDWVTRNWARVSPIEIDGLSGMRVPLVTGSRIDDLAGSLTYYFDDQHRVQRISFRGATGDEQKLVALAARQFHAQRERSHLAGLYVSRWNRRPLSVLRVEHATVVRADMPLAQKQITMEINRPRAYGRMSPEMETWMAEREPAKEKWRW